MKKKLKNKTIRTLKRVAPYYSVFFIAYAGLIMLSRNYTGMVFLFITYMATHYSYENNITFHFDCPKCWPRPRKGRCYCNHKCIAFSTLCAFLFGLPLFLPFHSGISILMCVPLGTTWTWLWHKAGKSKEKDRIITKPKVLIEMNESELSEFCRQKRLSADEEKFIILKFRRPDLKDVEIYRMINYSLDGGKTMKKRLRKIIPEL